MAEYAIELRGISKYFGKVAANEDISLTLKKGEILALLGENGSGKTTLMNMLSGIYFPDRGQIFIDGREVVIRSPKDAYALGIGMIHQHFKLIEVFTAAENIILGMDGRSMIDMKAVTKDVQALIDRYGFHLDLNRKVYDMSVSEKQTVEIVKMLYRGAGILILDEPTAVLTPQETDHLFSVLRKMKADGKSIIIITHKLHEVLDISDRVSILRKGRYIGTVDTKDATGQSLTEMMVGEKMSLDIERPEPENRKLCLEVRNLTCLTAVKSWALPALPEAARNSCWRLSQDCRRGPAASFSRIRKPAEKKSLWGAIRCPSSGWGYRLHLFRKTAWAWDWTETWACPAT